MFSEIFKAYPKSSLSRWERVRVRAELLMIIVLLFLAHIEIKGFWIGS